MPMTRMPSLAMLLVLANIALCLSVAHQRGISELGPPTSTVLSALPLGGGPRISAGRRPAIESMP
jgi:hypothetical protein